MQASPTVSPFNPLPSAGSQPNGGGSSNSAGSESLEAVDFQNFLTLLTAQLRNQDPLDPSDSTEFVAQLAQFTSVEQLVNVNNKIDDLATALVAEGIDKYASWIGKQAEVASAPAYFDGSAPVDYRFSGNSKATRVETVITSSSGKEVTRFASLNGPITQSWDGKIDGQPVSTGSYGVTALYYDSQDNVVGEEIAHTFGNVQAVRLDDGNTKIVLNGGVELTPEQVSGLGQ